MERMEGIQTPKGDNSLNLGNGKAYREIINEMVTSTGRKTPQR
jgi:hypothetical protein